MAKPPAVRPTRQAGGADLWLLANHDFRQPAQTLALLADNVADAGSKAERQELRNSITSMAGSLEAMVELMTLAARLESGLRQPSPARYLLGDALRPVLGRLGDIAAARRRRIDICGLELAAAFDAELVSAISFGVLLHAIKHATAEVITVAGVKRRSGVALEAVFAGPDPLPALSRMAFVELPPLPTAPDKPVVGAGLALAARLGALGGVGFAVGVARSGFRRIALQLPAG